LIKLYAVDFGKHDQISVEKTEITTKNQQKNPENTTNTIALIEKQWYYYFGGNYHDGFLH
jgi:hypothetical protein